MVLETMSGVGTAGAACGGTLFDYNRKNFLYDRKMRQEVEYSIMEFRIKQAEMWREDVRDIIGLTSVKMDTYLVVNAVQLGFVVMAFCEGRLAAGTPKWILGAHTISLAGAFVYLLMSVWLAMHATVAAKSYEVRILTQLVRLPVPTWSQLESARTYASSYEKVEPKQMFRVPFAMGSQASVLSMAPQVEETHEVATATPTPLHPAGFQFKEDALLLEEDSDDEHENKKALVGAAGASSWTDGVEATDPWGLEGCGGRIYELDGLIRLDPRKLMHVKLVREAQQYWQSYDGFARVSMTMGANQLLQALSYYVVGYVLILNHAVIAAWSAVLIFMAVNIVIVGLDMSLTAGERNAAFLFSCLGPLLTALGAEQWAQHTLRGNIVTRICAPATFAIQCIWMLFVLYVSRTVKQKDGTYLPTGFRSVLYLDIFGWIKQKLVPDSRTKDYRISGTQPVPSDPIHAEAGNGPAVQAVSYSRGQPKCKRPEELPGAAHGPRVQDLLKQDFQPHTFVPKEKGEKAAQAQEEMLSHHMPGGTPWRVFCSATVLLAILWLACGIIYLLQITFDMNILHIKPLLHAAEGSVEDDIGGGQPDSQINDTIVKPMHSISSVKPEGIHSSFVSWMQTENELVGGRRLATTWPRNNIHVHGLACGGSQLPVAVSTSHFGIFVAHLNGSSASVKFNSAPFCENVNGESLRDVSLLCDGKDQKQACRALVLHGQGRLLATCGLSHSEANGLQLIGQETEVAKLADGWLEDLHSYGAKPEEVASIAMSQQCSGKPCAYVETTDQRIIQVEQAQHAAHSDGGPEWFPTRVLQTKREDQAAVADSGLHLIQGRYLAVLKPGSKQRLEVLDTARSGALVGRWSLPHGEQWGAMCATGGHFYIMSNGPSPDIWTFPVPSMLLQEVASEAAKESTGVLPVAPEVSSPNIVELQSQADRTSRRQVLLHAVKSGPAKNGNLRKDSSAQTDNSDSLVQDSTSVVLDHELQAALAVQHRSMRNELPFVMM